MNRLLCYAHYDEKGGVKEFVKHALKSMTSSCSVIIFVSNSPLPDKEREYLDGICTHVIVNNNVGYDFFMWKSALGIVDCTEFDEIVLMNSSVYGPIAPIESVFHEMSSRSCDFWGITECFQMRPHVQSYFLVFGKKVITSAEFALFWNGVLPYKNKNQVVMSYEVGLTQWLVDSGFEMGVYCSLLRLADYVQRNGKKIKLTDNPSLKHAVDLLHLGVPFIKGELVKNNRVDLRLIAEYLKRNNYPVEYFKGHETEEKQACPLCGSRGRIYYKRLKDRLDARNIERYDCYKCLDDKCGVLWMCPPPSEHAMKFVYDNYYAYSEDASFESMPNLRPSMAVSILLAMLNSMMKLLGIPKKRTSYHLYGLEKVSPGKLLEIGCGNGDRLLDLRELGWDVVGHEIDDNVLKRLHAKNIEVVEGEIETTSLEDNQYDVILLSNVTEHVTNLQSLLSECHRLLKPGGKFYLSTPNANSFTHALFGKYWGGMDPPRQHVVFNGKVLQSALSETRFVDVKLRTVAVNSEMFTMHSLDILFNKWTYLIPGPRLGRELLPVASQVIIYLLNQISGAFGEEIFVVAAKKSA